MRTNSIDIQKIIRETRDTLQNPKEYFSSMPLTGGFAEPLVKAAIYGVVAGIFALIWSLLGWTAVDSSGMWGGVAGFMALIWAIVGSLITVFIGGAILLVISAICGGNTNYEANVRVAASLLALYPINAFLSFLYGISVSLGDFMGLGISLWSTYLIYLACIFALKGRESTAKIVAMVLLALALLGFWGSRKVSNTFEDFSDDYRDSPRMEQLD